MSLVMHRPENPSVAASGDLRREQVDDPLSGERPVDEERLGRTHDEHLTRLGGIS